MIQLTNETIYRSANQKNNLPIDQSANHPIKIKNKIKKQSANRPIKKTICRSTNQPIGQSKRIDQSTNQLVDLK